MSDLEKNIRLWTERIGNAASNPGGCEICAVTKTRTVEEINLCYDAGIRTIGENRVQELREKLPELDKRYKLHLIGSLQTNKLKYIAKINYVFN